LLDGTPVPVRQQPFVVSWLSIYACLEHWNHVFVGLLVKMVDLVAFIQDIRHQIWRWCVRNGGGDDVWHVPGVLMLREPELGVREELTHSSQMYIAAVVVSIGYKSSTSGRDSLT
jgi:hypothetical protein